MKLNLHTPTSPLLIVVRGQRNTRSHRNSRLEDDGPRTEPSASSTSPPPSSAAAASSTSSTSSVVAAHCAGGGAPAAASALVAAVTAAAAEAAAAPVSAPVSAEPSLEHATAWSPAVRRSSLAEQQPGRAVAAPCFLDPPKPLISPN